MPSASRVLVIRLLVLGVLVLAATVCAQKRPPISEQIAKTFGLDSFGQIERNRMRQARLLWRNPIPQKIPTTDMESANE